VTGGSSGLGLALAHALAKRDIPLLLVARDQHRLEQAKKELPASTLLFAADLATKEGRRRVVELIEEKTPDLLINNAGFGLYGPALSFSSSDLQEIVEVNVQALIELSVEGARSLRQKKESGVILNISSATAFFSFPQFSIYAASKAFVNSFSAALDYELKPDGIRVLTVCPGQIQTGFRQRASGNFPQKADGIVISAEKAAALILQQIDRRKNFSIIDWHYRLFVFFGKLFPKAWLNDLLEKHIARRHNRH
jgi:hypothetical protein